MAKEKKSKDSPYKIDPDQKMGAPRKYDIRKEADELLAWSLQDDATNILGFCNPKEYTWQRMWEWTQEDSYFSDAYEKARQRIGQRRERLMHEGKFKEGFVTKTAPMYDTSVHAFDRAEKRFDAELKLKAEKDSLDKIVQIIKYVRE